jgi:hypothetical protein
LDTPTYDSTSLLYVSDNGVNYEPYSSGIFFTKGKTYYFKATHKITSEDSEVLTIIPVVSNTAKAITISSVTPTTLTAQSLLSGSAVYARKVKVVVSTSAVSYSWYYRAASSTSGLTSAEGKLITTTSESSQELTINDSSLKMGYYY